MPRSPLLAAGQQATEERFVERVRLLCVHGRIPDFPEQCVGKDGL